MKFMPVKLLPLLLLPALVSAESLPISTSPEGARVYIIAPLDGAELANKVTVTFGLQGMGVAPAGTDKANTGHHHLLVDGKKLPALNKPLGGEVMHFGGGQTEKTLELSSGQHTLQLVLGNHMHVPHNPPLVSEVITITVK
ncbi:rod shape-determining protein RodA [Gammaproteobacteria bacterium 53_120_T64]|nr:rod shape-determining protein RodA [Gammaproteobacteria bacterium 53_120_T64]